MPTLKGFVEDSTGIVIGYACENAPDVILAPEDRYHRSAQKVHADASAKKVGLELPSAVKASLDSLPDADPKTAGPAPE